ncbi:MAG: hypothetical protein IJB26_05355 [Clostridia bacterium]|nr:hypothetical protein [Clostridia bacterium]
MALPDFPIPGMHFFVSGNGFTGSLKGLNYRIEPVKANEEEDIKAHFAVFVWYGMLSSEFAEKQAEATFPLDADGRAALIAWLEAQYKAYSEK